MLGTFGKKENPYAVTMRSPTIGRKSRIGYHNMFGKVID